MGNYIEKYNGGWELQTGGNASTVVDSNGNLGVGVAPSAWHSNSKALEIGASTAIENYGVAGSDVSLFYNNVFRTTSDNQVYKQSDYASIYYQNKGAHAWLTAPSGTAGNQIPWTTAMLLNASGNLGLGVTPSAWASSVYGSFIDIGNGRGTIGSALYYNNSNVFMSANAYLNSSLQETYKANYPASKYDQSGGNHKWFTAPSGTPGNAISWTTGMTLDTSGNLGLGITPSAWNVANKALDIGNSGAIYSLSTANADVIMTCLCNAYYSSTGYRYKQSKEATGYQQYNGTHTWLTSPSGTAGNPITWTTAMTLDANSKLSVTGGVSVGNVANASATTLDWYEEATATLTATGMTTSPTGTATFTRVGNVVTIEIPQISGTSNATTFTLTGVPTNFRPSSNRNCLAVTQDNGLSLTFARMRVNTDGTITLYKDGAGNPFTASGVKGVFLNTTTYHI